MRLPGEPLSPQELRLGNIVLGPNGKPIQIEYLSQKLHSSILERKVTITNPIINQGIEGITGLPLDEKWFQLLGLYSEDDGTWTFDNFVVHLKGDAVYGLKELPSMEIRYVHELQNLMFAIRRLKKR